MPRYAFDDRLKVDREFAPPPASLFMSLGFNEKKESDIKHYRRYYPDELEKVKEVIPRKPFHEENVFRGQSRGLKKSFFSGLFGGDDSGESSTLKEVGYFKGMIKIFNKQDHDQKMIKDKLKNDLIVKMINEVHLKKKGEQMHFNYELLETYEGRGKFTTLMDELGLGQLNLANYFAENTYEDKISRMML